MNIRTKLTLQFATIVAVLLLLSFLATYFISAAFSNQNFYDRLERKANMTARLLVDVDEISSDLLLKIEEDNPSLPYERIKVFNFRDTLIFSTDKNRLLQTDKFLLDRVRLEKKVFYDQGDFQAMGFLFEGKFDRFVVIAAARDIQGERKMQNLSTILMLVFAVNMILVLVSGWFYSGRALKPISGVISQVEKITASQMNLRVHEGTEDDEIAQLARTFNSMLDRLEAAFKIQKNFIANASHELRTPLTSITGQLEVKLLKQNTEEEYRKTIQSVLEDMRNLNNISNRLLLLAQTSGESPESDFKNLRLDEIVWEARTDFLKLKEGAVVDVSISAAIEDDAQLTVLGNEYLMKTAIINLMDNGCKYSGANRVEVKITNREAMIVIDFIDQGIGIAPDDVQYIFEPFYRGKNTAAIKGHGIGLSLVQRIVQMQHGRIEVQSEPGNGSVFTLYFPVAR